MTNAFDLKDLADRLKAKGLPVAENILQEATKEIFAWAGESCAIKGGLFLVGTTLLPILSDQVVRMEDSIDGIADANS